MRVRHRMSFKVLLAVVIGLGALALVLVVPHNYDGSIGGKHQIMDVTISSSGDHGLALSLKLARVTHSDVKSTTEVIDSSTTPIYRGERLVKDDSLGPYVVATTLFDTRLQEAAKAKLHLEGLEIPNATSHIANRIRVAYPPDDSMLIIYVGCKVKPVVSTSEIEDALVILIQPE